MAENEKPHAADRAPQAMTAAPEPTRTCCYCAYAFWDSTRFLANSMAGWPTLLTCFNHVDHPGQPWQVGPDRTCRNFRFKRRPVVRLEPPEPTDDRLRYIALTQGKFAIVDAANYEWLNQYKWTAMKAGTMWYARRHSKGKSYLMHREIMQPPPGMVVDHSDHNGLNNLESNLRVCTPTQNQRNCRPIGGSSSYKGVSYDKEHRKWEAGITVKGKRIHIGLFDTEIEAARAYDRKARELFGEYAYLNFPDETQAEGIDDG